MNTTENKYTTSELIQYLFTNPKKAFQDVIIWERNEVVHISFLLVGIFRAFDRAELQHKGDSSSLTSIIISCIIIGGISGYFFMFFYSFCIDFTGQWINGKSKKNQIKNIISWAGIPTTFLLIIVLLKILTFGDDTFKSEISLESNQLSTYLRYFFTVIEILLSIIAARALIIGISIAQQFSILKAILNVILAALLIVVPIIIIVLVFSLF